METLTYGDRAKVHQLLKDAEARTGVTDTAVVAETHTKLLRGARVHGLDRAFTLAALKLSYNLLFSELPDVRREARTALLYLILESDAIPDGEAKRGLDDDMYVLHRALRRIDSAKRAPTATSSHAYLKEEHVAVVMKELEARRQDSIPVARIAETVRTRLDGLRESCPKVLIDELSRNVDWLVTAGREAEDRETACWALSALSYLSASNSAIPETLGPVALLDDLFATHVALQRCKSPRAAIVDILDECTTQLPLLDLLVLRDEFARSTPSEYTLLSLVLANAAGNRRLPMANLVYLPLLGGTPLQVAFLAALRGIHDRRDELARLPELELGDLVQVIQGDTKAVGRFRGFEESDGVTRLIVQDSRSTGRFPVTPMLLSSLTIAKRGKTGGVRNIRANIDDLPLTPLDFLLDTTTPLRLEKLGCRVLYVCNSMERTRQMLESTTICRVPLAEVIPVGRLPDVEDGEPVGWSRRWQATPSVLATTSSLFEACNYLESSGNSAADLVVIEDAGQWASSADLVSDLSRSPVPVIAFGAFADEARLTTYTNAGFKAARWDVEELEQLNWEPRTPSIAMVERRIRTGLRSKPAVEVLDSPLIDECSRLLEEASQSLQVEGGNTRADAALGAAWAAFVRATRWFLPVQPQSLVAKALTTAAEGFITQQLQRVLGEETLRAFSSASDALFSLSRHMCDGNRKWDAFRSSAVGESSIVVIAHNDRSASEYAQALQVTPGFDDARVLTIPQVPDAGFSKKSLVIVPGWYRSTLMTRLLEPPAAARMRLLVWGFERQHHARWVERQAATADVPSVIETAGRSYRHRRRRAEAPAARPADSPPLPDEVLESLELGMMRASAYRIGEVSRAGVSHDDLADAVAVSFKDGQLALFARDGAAPIVTDLFREGVEDSRGRVRYKAVNELAEGDLVLFHTGAEGDAIRAQADALVEAEHPGTAVSVRAHADLWRMALIRYRQSLRLSATEVAARLAQVGCSRNVMTVRKWLSDDSLIGPQNYSAEVEKVLTLTQDPELRTGLKKCVGAIRYLRGKHMEASGALARAILQAARHENRRTGDFGAGLHVAEVNLVDSDPIQVSRRVLRRLTRIGDN